VHNAHVVICNMMNDEWRVDRTEESVKFCHDS
jgi:3,4-dihydroxy-2-butanone 4-phosphate synthase